VHYLEELDFDIDTSVEYSRDSRKVDNHINRQGLGYIVFTYAGYKHYKETTFNGTVRLEVQSQNKIKALYDLKITDGDKFQEFIFDTAIGIFEKDGFVIRPTYLANSYFLGFSQTIDINDNRGDDIVRVNHSGLLKIALSKK